MKVKISYMLCLLMISLITTAQNGAEMLIKNGTVLTVTNGTLENTDILIKNGKISKIGQHLNASDGATKIDATGQYVMPGIIDAHSHIALEAVNEGTQPNTAQVWVGDALIPTDVSIYRALAGGCTASHAMHGSANAIGGQCETIKHRYGSTNPEDIRMEGAPRTIKFALGENPMRVHGEGQGIQPATRMGIEMVFRKAFADGKAYAAKWEAYKNSTDPNAIAPKYDRKLQTMADILSGDIIIHCHSYRADEIVMLMNVCRDFDVNKLVFQHVNEGFKVAPELADFGAGASVFADWWAYKFEVYYSTAYNAAILSKNGVITSINSDSGNYIRHLYHQAAKSQRYGGLTDDEALALITINPAIQLGIDDRVGSIEVGKDADIAIFNAHPLSIYAINQKTIVDGVLRFDIENDPDDMRIIINPEEEFPGHMEEELSHDNCMQDVWQFFADHSNHK